MPGNVLPSSLREALRKHQIVPFAGAGVSRSVCLRDSNTPAFPDWMELLGRAAERLLKEGKDEVATTVTALLNEKPPDLLDAARKAQDALKPAVWADFLYRIFDVKLPTVADETLALARKCWRLGSNVIITTNYDDVLKWARLPSQIVPWHIENSYAQVRFANGTYNDPAVWHLHGHINSPHELILSPDGYERLYNSDTREETQRKYKAALSILRTVLVTRRLLFVGFSFADQVFNRQLSWIREIFEGQVGPHFALIHAAQLDETRQCLQGLMSNA